ncbi:hypothetical protein ACFQ8T_01545 [Isoptericola sp. NPDC056618]|uniref:hypothetical protein n=1 Tax=Isoptericola sp. NPDC056618 TaxID=3345878 RepID=UPI00368F752A
MTSHDERMPAEARARMKIDAQWTAAGWSVQDGKDLKLFVADGVAVREQVMAPDHGRVDYLLYVDRRVVGVIEAKPEGTTLSGVEWQSAMYATGLPAAHRKRSREVDGRLPFVFEASGSETHFTNGFDPEPRARAIFAFPKPETLARILRDADADPDAPTWRTKVRSLPELDVELLRPAQIKAIEGTERALSEQRFDRDRKRLEGEADESLPPIGAEVQEGQGGHVGPVLRPLHGAGRGALRRRTRSPRSGAARAMMAPWNSRSRRWSGSCRTASTRCPRACGRAPSPPSSSCCATGWSSRRE